MLLQVRESFAIRVISGLPLSNADFEGQYVLLYFGFSLCPDICPQELRKISEVLEQLKADSIKNVTAVFISIDGKRDSCAQLQSYARQFPGKFVAVNATPTAAKKLSRLFRVYFNELQSGPGLEYMIDHSIIHYLISPKGDFLDFFGKSADADNIARRIRDSALKV